jgi:hypothetical protein
MPIVTGIFEILAFPLQDELETPNGCSLRTLFVNKKIPCPGRYLAKSMRMIFLEDGRLVPINDPIWFRTRVTLTLNQKEYWDSDAYLVADPVCFVGAFDKWMEWTLKMREEFTERWTRQTFLENGIQIEWNDVFLVKLKFSEPDVRRKLTVKCVLAGSMSRAVL